MNRKLPLVIPQPVPSFNIPLSSPYGDLSAVKEQIDTGMGVLLFSSALEEAKAIEIMRTMSKSQLAEVMLALLRHTRKAA